MVDESNTRIDKSDLSGKYSLVLRGLDSFDCRKLVMYMLSNSKTFLLLFCELFFTVS